MLCKSGNKVVKVKINLIRYSIISWTTRCMLTLFIAISSIHASSLWAQKTYYIDSQNGNDNSDGISIHTAWRSHAKVSTVALQPGDTVAFKKGSQFNGPIQIIDSGSEGKPIVITSYGEGERPRFTNPDDLNLNGNCIRISGSWIILENLYFHDTPATKNASRLRSIFLMGAVLNKVGADHNVIRNNVFMKCTKAIQSSGEYTLITHNYLDGPSHALWNEPGSYGGWGPMGIQLGIGNQEVCYNVIKNYLTIDSDYGSDGGAIELDDGRFHKDNFYIHHNYSEGNAGFIESSWGADHNPYVQEVHNLRVAFNINFDGQAWLYMWAPCHDCYFDNNTVIRTHDFTSPLNDVAYLAYDGIHFRNNLFIYTGDAYQGPGAGGVVTENNWYLNANNWSKVHWDANQAGSGDPGLVDLDNGDYHPITDSPLVGKGTNLREYYSVDFEDKPLPDSGAWTIGALQPAGFVTVTSPHSGAIFYAPAQITIRAEASSDIGSVSKVEFYSGSNKLNEAFSSPYLYAWNVDSVGVFLLKCVATFDDGSHATSSSLWVLVTDSCSHRQFVWHSYDVQTDHPFQPILAPDRQGSAATAIELYMSNDAGGVERERLFNIFNSSQHFDDFNRVEAFWTNTTVNNAYPYAGRSTIDRGSDSGENNTPEPGGVRDLQLHPPDSDHLTVAAFIVPCSGTYSVSDLAVRRVHNQGNIVNYLILNPDKEIVASLNASNDQVWTRDDSTYDLGHLSAGDRLYFAVGRGKNDQFYWDATEISWTVTKKIHNRINLDYNDHPQEYYLGQNFPNPFNSYTVIPVQLPRNGLTRLFIHDIHGRIVRTLVNGRMSSGIHTIQWNARDDMEKLIASGIYFYRLDTGYYSQVRKLVLIQ
ncbi:T9SS type A sorting domain-containing protein [candidate division KSB1 bacterium]|nr:T9SS type A sorting domain-containing protein [candidate division KSB1 bacterium]